jgi:o-succinylbenzoate synthase
MRLAWEIVELRLRDTFTTTHSASEVRRNVIVEIRDDAAGRTGLGEAAPYYGESPDGITADLDKVRRLFRKPKSRPGEDWLSEVAGSVRAALETAMFDLLARDQGVPLAVLASGDPARPVPTSFTLGRSDPDETARKAEAARGWSVLKIKVGGPHDAENLAVVRRICPAAELRLDANGAWTEDQAAEMIPRLAEARVAFVEQPLPPGDPAAYRRLRRKVKTPIYVDESVRTPDDVRGHAGAADGIVVKLAKCGGIGPVLDCVQAARAAGMKVMIGCMVESSVGITAAAHLASHCDSADLDGHLLLADDPFVGVTLSDGRLHLPPGPGLGVRRRPAGR